MADHFYSILGGDSSSLNRAKITVATSSTSANPIEVRITDGSVRPEQVYTFLEFFADLVATRDPIVITPGTLKV